MGMGRGVPTVLHPERLEKGLAAQDLGAGSDSAGTRGRDFCHAPSVCVCKAPAGLRQSRLLPRLKASQACRGRAGPSLGLTQSWWFQSRSSSGQEQGKCRSGGVEAQGQRGLRSLVGDISDIQTWVLHLRCGKQLPKSKSEQIMPNLEGFALFWSALLAKHVRT